MQVDELLELIGLEDQDDRDELKKVLDGEGTLVCVPDATPTRQMLISALINGRGEILPYPVEVCEPGEREYRVTVKEER